MSREQAQEQTSRLAMLMGRDGFELDPAAPLGRQSAGASFLEAYLKYWGSSEHFLAVDNQEEAGWFHKQAEIFNSSAKTMAYQIDSWGEAGKQAGTFHIPDPQLDLWSWRRMPWGDGAFSLMGLVHTLCSKTVQKALGQFATAPVRPWDALICTSTAARAAVEGFLDRQEQWLKYRNKAQSVERPQLPVIPLGIHVDAWAPPEGLQKARKAARRQLKISPEAKVVLIAGRLDCLTKTQPAPLLRSLAALHDTELPDLELLVYGEAPNPGMAQRWRDGAQQLAANLPIHWIPGKELGLATAVRWAADVFVSLADNPQETFGITPLEAMASGLPCVVSDWDGYRDTVVQPGEAEAATGLRIPTRLVDGLGAEEAFGLLHNTLDYDLAVGRVAQGISVDMDVFEQQLTTLLNDSDMCSAMGAAGQQRVRSLYDWQTVIEQWRDLTQDLNDRRKHGVKFGLATSPQLPPWLPDTSQAFGCFASTILPTDWSPEAPGVDSERALLNNRLQDWDKDLLKSMSARRRGSWLKQGLVKP